MSKEEDIIWLRCPDCGSKIGIILTVGKIKDTMVKEEEEWPPETIEDKLATAGVDIEMVDIEVGEEIVTVSPKKFLGDLWGPINDALRGLGGIWIRDGRNSHWELERSDIE